VPELSRFLCYFFVLVLQRMFYRADCRYFKGHIPCDPHKKNGYHCEDCPAYVPVEKRILIIKLGAIGDVIRTTPLVRAYRKLYPNCKITWITLHPDILPAGDIDEILKLDLNAVLYVSNTRFDIAICLDKEKEAGGLMQMIQAGEKYGYELRDGEIQPVNSHAVHKFSTGLFDDVSKANTLSYGQEIFDICGLPYTQETYLLDNHSRENFEWDLDRSKPVIGLNTGCGDRWTTRLWSTEKWVELIGLIKAAGYVPLLLGGAQEDARNRELHEKTGARYLGHFPLKQFINLIDQCDLVVTQVTMGMHLTIGLGKKIVLMNNIFNPAEFDLFGKGEIVQPNKNCRCFYRGTCIDGLSCMEELPASKVFSSLERVLAKN
jgi:ADP-heptose:LPS heptosyltransferase